MRRTILLAVLCLAIQPAFGADKWISIHTKNFTLASNAGESDLRRTGRIFEEFRSAMALLFPKIDDASGAPTTILLFKNDDSFKPYKPVVKGEAANVVAFFQPGTDVNYIATTAGLDSPGVVFHQYAHVLLRENAGSLPLWISEGIAECYSTFDPGGRQNEYTLGRAPETHAATLSKTAFIPLKNLFDVRDNSPEYNEQSRQSMFYAESWATVHYFLFGPDERRRTQFQQFVTALAKGGTVDASFTKAFQTDYGTIENEVREYIRKRSSWPVTKVTSKEAPSNARPPAPAVLSDAETEYYLGDLLLHLNRLQEAETHLSSSLSRSKDAAPAQAAMALLRVRQKKYDEALAPLKTAAESDSKNPMIAFYYAYVLERSDADAGLSNTGERHVETIRTYARKSIELAPRFVEAYALLARADFNSGEHLEEAEEMLQKALSIVPGREDLQLLLGETYLRTNQKDDARTVLEALQRNSSSSATSRQAEKILNQGPQSLALAEITEDLELESARKDRPIQEVQSITLSDLAAPPPKKAEDTVIEAITPTGPNVEGQRVSGLLVNLDCANGLTLRVRSQNDTVELHSSNPDKIQFLSYTSDVGNNVQCGPRNPGTPVTVTYRTVPGGPGDPLVIEFTQK